MKLYQGDIVLMPFPFTDLSHRKMRPAIVVSNSLVNKTEDVVVAAITSNLRDDVFTFQLDRHHLTKPLHTVCEVRCDKLFTVSKSIIEKKISALKEQPLMELCNQITPLLSYEAR